MTDYNTGLISKIDGSGFTDFLFQSHNLTIEADEYEAKDENGNTVAHVLKNHRAKMTVEAIIPAAAKVPVPGETVGVKGISVPTVTAAGAVSGDFKVDTTITTAVNFKVVGTPAINQSGTDFTKATFDLARYLVNEIPT